MEKTVGMRIQRLREKKGWSQIELANKVGISNSVISRIESGKRKIRADELQKIAELLEVRPDQLLGDLPPGTSKYKLTDERRKKLIELYDQLPEDQQRMLDQIAEVMLKARKQKGDDE